MDNESKLIDEFHKNSQELIRVNQTKFKDRDYIDMRVWVEDKTAGQFDQATKKGLTISVSLLSRLLEALQKAEKALEKERKEAEIEPDRPLERQSQEG